MRIGIFGGDTGGRTIDDVVDDARAAEQDGFTSYALPQIFGLDAMGVLAIVGREVPRHRARDAASCPAYGRHPVTMAQQALTVQVASGGRFSLGIGLSHQMVIENMFGLSFEHPLRHMREYLSVLMPLLQTGKADFDGETITTHAGIDVANRPDTPVLVAALGPKMLELAGTVTDGTVTWMTGPATLSTYTVPTITAAAEKAGRPAPRCCRESADLRDHQCRRGSRARSQGLPGLRLPAFVPGDARPRRRCWSGRRCDRRRRGHGAEGRRTTRRHGGHRIRRVDLRWTRRTRRDASPSPVDALSGCATARDVDQRAALPLELLEALTVQEVEIAPDLKHLEIYTMRGLLTLLWHGSMDAEAVLVTCGGGMGSLLGPADSLYHALGTSLAARGIGTVRVGYRKPNDLSRCVHDVAAAADLAGRRGAAALRRDGTFVRRRGRNPNRRGVGRALSGCRHAVDAISRM